MNKITFKAAYGDEDRAVVISEVSGSLGTIHIYVDNYYSGTVNNKAGYWSVYWVAPTPKSVHQELNTMDDSDAILDRMIGAGWIEENN